MISSILIIIFSVVSLAGVVALVYKKPTEEGFEWSTQRKLSVSLFTLTHSLFLIVGIVHLFKSISITWLIAAMILLLASRAYNGRSLYGKNCWQHYVVNTALMIFIIAFF